MRRSRAASRMRRHARVRKHLAGTADRPRLAVFRSNRYIYAQIINDELGATIAAASSQEKEVAGTLTTETAEKVGKLVGERATAAGVSEVVFDRGGYAYHGRVKAVADGARSAGLSF